MSENTGPEHPPVSRHEAEAGSEPVSLAELAETLCADLPNHPAGRTARTVMSGPRMRAVVIAMREGAEMAEHESPPAATLYVIKGQVTLKGDGQEWPLEAGSLVPIPAHRHSVEAHADAAFLLTVALAP
jgi:quercetin dioxygenase-like cupin family protein